MSFLYFREKKWWRYLLFLLLTLTAAIFFLRRIHPKEKPFVPTELLAARIRGASISEGIVAGARESVNTLKTIRQAELGEDYNTALNLVLTEIQKNEQVREDALQLSYELVHITEKLAEVRPEEAAQVGLQATIYGAQITQRLINYNTYTFQLLDLLKSHFMEGSGTQDTAIAEQIQGLIDKMNEEAEAINALNNEYKKAMQQFDVLTNQTQ
ncbi:MAG: hypothetical protein V1652_00485 [bacterium]